MMSITRNSRLPIGTLLALLMIGQHLAQGAEGAASYYFPGAAGSFAVATAPMPGFTLVNQTLFYSASASRAVLSGRALGNLEVDAVYNYLGGIVAVQPRVAGGVFAVGGFVPLGRSSLEASLTAASGLATGVKASDFNIGDMVLMPAALYWNKGSVHLKVAENIFAPTGHYDVSQPMNVGRNYWGFDTIAAL
ncbi:MAG TPA: transporter, partial [Bryobacteraceae bacterium]|nr:transporter [Bryobacteraceae bacterium]